MKKQLDSISINKRNESARMEFKCVCVCVVAKCGCEQKTRAQLGLNLQNSLIILKKM